MQIAIIKFYAAKSPLIVFPHTKTYKNYVDLYINNEKIPFVNHVKHLGHVLSNRNSDILDIDYN